MKKQVVWLLALLACLGLAGCANGGQSSSPQSGSAPAASSQAEEQRPEQPLFVAEGDTMWHSGLDLENGTVGTLTSNLSVSGPAAIFTMERAGGGGLRLAGVAGTAGQDFIGDFTEAMPHAFDEYGDLRRAYMVQFTVLDMDGDGTREVVVSMGDGSTSMHTVVYRYVGGDVPFAKAGEAAGEVNMTWQDGVLHVVYNAGDEDVFRYESGVLAPGAVEEALSSSGQ